MKNDLLLTITLWAFRLLLAGIFIYAAIGKLAEPQRFLDAVRGYDLLPDPWAAWLAMSLPWLELITGVALLTPWFALGASVIITGMFTVFIAAIASAWSRGLSISCGCFGGGDTVSSYLDVISLRLVLLVIAAITGYLLWKREGLKVRA